MVKIRVPATTANVGVGFDCLGIALNLYTYFTFEKADKFSIHGCEKRFQNKDNLVYTSFLKTLNHLNKEEIGVSITIEGNVPVSRGLGSSATCVVAGVLGACEITNTKLDKDAILSICTQIEGHPDNVAPAIYGGLMASYQDEKTVISVPYQVDKRFRFLALIPEFETETKAAREVLPKTLPFSTVVKNSAKLSVVLKGFELYEANILSEVMDDEVHEPYRKSLIYEYDEVRKICEEIESVCFYISGSGSTLMNVMRDTKRICEIQNRLDKLKYGWKCVLLDVEQTGASVC